MRALCLLFDRVIKVLTITLCASFGVFLIALSQLPVQASPCNIWFRSFGCNTITTVSAAILPNAAPDLGQRASARVTPINTASDGVIPASAAIGSDLEPGELVPEGAGGRSVCRRLRRLEERELIGTPYHPAGTANIDFIKKLTPAVCKHVQDSAPEEWWTDGHIYKKSLHNELKERAAVTVHTDRDCEADIDLDIASESEHGNDDLLEHGGRKRVRTPPSV